MKDKKDEVLETSVKDLDLSDHCGNCLIDRGFNTVNDIVKYYKEHDDTFLCHDCIFNPCMGTFSNIAKYCKEHHIALNEAVDHPSHYNREGAMECIDEMRLIFGDYETAIFCKLNAYKYRYRAGSKGDAEEDLRKSDWYIKKYKELRDKPCGYMASTTDNSNITLLSNRTKD